MNNEILHKQKKNATACDVVISYLKNSTWIIHVIIIIYMTTGMRMDNIFLTTAIYIYSDKSGRVLTHSSCLCLRREASSASCLSFSCFSSISFFKRASSSCLFISSSSSGVGPKNKTECSLKIYLQHLRNSFEMYINFLKCMYSTSVDNSHSR